MKGYDLAKAVRRLKGKVSVPMAVPGKPPVWLNVEKIDLIAWAERMGDHVTGFNLCDDPKKYHYLRQEKQTQH
jgi:hypothetical protein